MITKKTYIPSKPRNKKLTNATSGSASVGKTEFNQVASESHTHANKGVLDQITEQMLDIIASAVTELVKSDDTIDLTDENVLSSLRTLLEIKNRAISKLTPDTAKEVITFLKGIIAGGTSEFAEMIVSGKITAKDIDVNDNLKTSILQVLVSATLQDAILKGQLNSETFTSGFLGEGFRLSKINDRWTLELDDLIIRKTMQVYELIVQRIRYQGGQVLHSPAGGKITKVTNGGNYWRIEHDSPDDFITNDQVQCQNFKVGSAAQNPDGSTTFEGVSVKRYWRLVTSYGRGWFNLSKTDMEAGSAEPEVGDDIVVLGNRTDPTRQNAYMIVSTGANSPYTAHLAGINSYSTAGKEVVREGNLSGIVDEVFGQLSGYGLYGQNVYLKGRLAVQSGSTSVRVPADKGAWSAGTYYYYDRVSYNGSLWLCLAQPSTTEAPSEGSPAWEKQVEKGQDGGNGISVTLVDVEYAVNTSTSTPPTTGWTTTAPTLTGSQQLWTRTKTTYSSGNPTYSTPANITPKTGAIGQGIESIVEEFYLSIAKNMQSGGSWSTTPPTWEYGKYIWTRSKITYKNPTSIEYTTPVVSSEWEAVNELKIGTANLLNNSCNFRSNGWNGGFASNGGGYTIDNNILFNGKPTLRTTVGNGLVHSWLKLENNVEYTYSAMVRANENYGGSGSTSLHFHAGYNNQNQSKITIVRYDQTVIADEWKLIYTTFKLTQDADSFRPFIYRGSGSTVFNFAFLGLVKGNRPLLQASQSDSDVQSETTRVETETKARFNVNETNIQANVSAITTVSNSVTGLTTRVSAAESSITAQATQIQAKVSQTEYNANNASISNQFSLFNQRAGNIELSVSDILVDNVNYYTLQKLKADKYDSPGGDHWRVRFTLPPNTQYAIQTTIPRPSGTTMDCWAGIEAQGVFSESSAVNGVSSDTPRILTTDSTGNLIVSFRKTHYDSILAGAYKITLTKEYLPAKLLATGINIENQLITLTANKTVFKSNSGATIAVFNSAGTKIVADAIALEGLTTINSNFKVLLDGSIEAVNGKFTGQITANIGTLGTLTMQSGGYIDLPPTFASRKGRLDNTGLSLVYDGANSQKIEWYSGLGTFAGQITCNSQGRLKLSSSFGVGIGLDFYGDAITITPSSLFSNAINFNASDVSNMKQLTGLGILNFANTSMSFNAGTEYSIFVDVSLVAINPLGSSVGLSNIRRGTQSSPVNPTNGDIIILVNISTSNHLYIRTNGNIRYGQTQFTLDYNDSCMLVYYGGYWHAPMDKGQ